MKIAKIVIACLAAVLLILAGFGVFYFVVPMTAAIGDDLAAPEGHPGAPSANGFQPVVIDVRAECRHIDESLLELKIDGSPPTSGVYDFSDGVNTLALLTRGTYFGWWSMLGIDGVIVKGGGEANGYKYAALDDHAGEWFQDNLLHAPLDGPGGDPFELTEILFCYDLEEEDTGSIVVAKESTEPDVKGLFDFQASATLGSFALRPGQERVFNGVPADAAYEFSEMVPTGWSLAGIVCVETGEAETRDDVSAIEEQGSTVYLDDGEDIVCTFTNEPQAGQLMVVKELVPEDDPGLFDLEIDEEVEKEDASDGDATPLMDVVVGEHTIGESAGADTELENYDTAYRCVKEASLDEIKLTNSAGAVLNTVFVDPGDVITCTITNTRKTGDVVIKKQTDPDAAETKFPFASNVEPPSFSLADGESKLFEDLPVGETATFTETVPDGWELGAIDCTADPTSLLAVMDPSIDIEPVADEVITCTFSNVAVPFIAVDKSADPTSVVEPGSKVEYSIKVTSLGTTGPVTLTGLTDDIYGDLTSGSNISISNSTCQDNIKIDPGKTYQCGFKGMVEGEAGISVTDVVTATVVDGGEANAEASDSATVRVVYEPPDTGVDMPVPMVIGGFAAMGLTLLGAGAWVRRRTLMSG